MRALSKDEMPPKTLQDVISEIENWLRLATFVNEPLRLSLLHVLHNRGSDPNYVGLPETPIDLYNELQNQYHGNRALRKLLRQSQYCL